MNVKNTRLLLWSNYVVVGLLQVVATCIIGIGLELTETIWISLILLVSIDLLALTNRLINHRSEVFKYILLSVLLCLIDFAFLDRSRYLFILEFGILSFFFGCLLVRILVRSLGTRFSLAQDWDFFFDPLNWLLTSILYSFSIGLTFLVGFVVGRL